MSGNSIKVVCRFRPQNKLEIREGGQPIIDIDDEGTVVKLKASFQKRLKNCNFSRSLDDFNFLGQGCARLLCL